MPVSCNDVWQRIIAEGIASDDECRLWADRATSQNNQQDFASGEELLKSLVSAGLLTGYQARVIAGKAQSPLRMGPWIVRGPSAHPVGKGWWLIEPAKGIQEVNPQAAISSGTHHICWGRWLTVKDFAAVTGPIDVSTVLKVFDRFQSSDVDSIIAEDLGKGQLFFHKASVTVPTLWEGLQQASPNQINPMGIMLQVSRQVAELHSRELVHGRLAPDRILWDGQHKISLLFDPLVSLARRQPHGAYGLLSSQLPKEQLRYFSAPELSAVGTTATSASDVYSLGMIGKWILQQTKQKSTPSGHWTQPMELALSKCLAADPKARFSSAAGLVEALEKARPKPGKRERKKVRSLIPVALSGFAALLLVVMVWIGLQTYSKNTSSKDSAENDSAESRQLPSERPDEGIVGAVESSLFSNHFRVVDNQQVNWLPPLISKPVSLELLPPGAQAYMAFRPRQMQEHDQWKATLAVLKNDARWNSIFIRWSEYIGLSMESVEQVTIGFYGSIGDSHQRSILPGLLPELAVRVDLNTAIPLRDLLTLWKIDQEQSGEEPELFSSGNDRAYYVPSVGLSLDEVSDGRFVQRYCVGPIRLMNEVVEMRGMIPPVIPAFQRLLDRSFSEIDFCLIASPRYLQREQRASPLLLPDPVQEIFASALGGDSRAVMIQSHLSSVWYWEVQRLPEMASESALISQHLKQEIAGISERMAQWLDERVAHPSWQPIAQRLPQMLKLAAENSRFGNEDGIVIVNGYLPSTAASNFMIASWMLCSDPVLRGIGPGLQAAKSIDSEMKVEFNLDQFLNKKIRVFFDQESLETTLQILEDSANEGQPDPRRRIRFDLDSSAFEQAGITRNQQLRDFRLENQTLHDALTELVKRANPNPNVDDLRSDDQRLVWIVKSDPEQAGIQMIVLTTRAACEEQGWDLPTVFSAAND